jgi:hypothetical protein
MGCARRDVQDIQRGRKRTFKEQIREMQALMVHAQLSMRTARLKQCLMEGERRAFSHRSNTTQESLSEHPFEIHKLPNIVLEALS